MTKILDQKSPTGSMNRLAAAFLLVVIAFVAGFSWYSWQAEKAFLIKEESSVLEFVSRQMDAYLDRIENGLSGSVLN